MPIVRPEWIVDCIAAGHKIPVHPAQSDLQCQSQGAHAESPHGVQINDYVLWRLRDQPGQQHLKSFAAQPHVRSDEAGRAEDVAAVRSPDGKMLLQGVRQSQSCDLACSGWLRGKALQLKGTRVSWESQGSLPCSTR